MKEKVGRKGKGLRRLEGEGPDLRRAGHLPAPGGPRGQPRCPEGPGPSTLHVQPAKGLWASGGYGTTIRGVGKGGAALRSRAAFLTRLFSEWPFPPPRARRQRRRQRRSRGCASRVAPPRG